MNLLAIDTSTKKLSLAIARKGEIVRFSNVKLNRPLSCSIMPSIKNVLARAKMELSDLDGFVVGLGPGSFTSLRVGVSTVKGLAFAVNKPVVGISSLDAIAMNVLDTDKPICVVADAKRKMVYSNFYQRTNQKLKRKGKYLLAPIEDVLKPLKGDVLFVGDGVPLFFEEIKKAKHILAEFAHEKHFFPLAKNLVPLALEKVEDKGWDDVDEMIPLYLYPDNCQIRK